MHTSEKDYLKLYQLQDRFLEWWAKQGLPFYLSGGTALGRFYLNHRFSEDLDFFLNDDASYGNYVTTIRKNVVKDFKVDIQQTLFTEDFTRFFISDNDIILKIEFVNDVASYAGSLVQTPIVLLDNPLNILANKLTAIMGRDEPKDVFDILFIAWNYSFNWFEVFNHAKLKSVINEIDIEKRLHQFPVEWFEKVDWINGYLDLDICKKTLKKIADDFLTGNENSVCRTNTLLINAVPNHHYPTSDKIIK
jgi:predicted nucleotidyltransferase component of viral defense system